MYIYIHTQVYGLVYGAFYLSVHVHGYTFKFISMEMNILR